MTYRLNHTSKQGIFKSISFWIVLLYYIICIIPVKAVANPVKNPTSKSYNSVVALVGGGANAAPGEISLAHNGVLFCDELPEFQRQTLEVLRQPLEDRTINVSRAKYTVDYPCSFMFVASMNPCPCGYFGDPHHRCVCTPGQIGRYLSKISGPLLDRIDIRTKILRSRYFVVYLHQKSHEYGVRHTIRQSLNCRSAA